MKPHIVVVGSLNMDLVTETERFPKQGETVLGDTFSQIRGGKGANQAVAAARLGAVVSVIGAIGDDSFGQQLRDGLIEDEIHTQGLKTVQEKSSGIAQITIADGDNSIIVVPGANAGCSPEWVEQNSSIIAQADMLMLQLEIPLASVQKALEIARKYRVPVILNPAPAQELSKDILEKVTYLTPNQSELAHLSSVPLEQEEDYIRAAEELWDSGVEHLIVTRGKEGSLYVKQGDTHFSSYPSYVVPVVDTTGAGDAFNAGLAVFIAEGHTIEEAVSFASVVAALAVTKYGAQPGMPTREEVEQFIAKEALYRSAKHP